MHDGQCDPSKGHSLPRSIQVDFLSSERKHRQLRPLPSRQHCPQPGFRSGLFSGGSFKCQGVPIPVSHKVVEFNGREPHGSGQIAGTRISVVAYTHSTYELATSEEASTLRSLGFLVPGETYSSICLKQVFALDLLSGKRRPLAMLRGLWAYRHSHRSMPTQTWGGHMHDLADPNAFNFSLRLAWSGCVALAAASPPRSSYSVLQELPEGPRALRTYDNLEASP